MNTCAPWREGKRRTARNSAGPAWRFPAPLVPGLTMTAPSTGAQQARRLFLVEDDPLVRRGYKLLLGLESDLDVCGEAEDADEAFVWIRDLRPDLAVVDLTLRQSNGLDLIRQLREECPQVQVLVVSMHDQTPWIEEALRAGAQGYLPKDECADQLIGAIREVLQGRRFLSPRLQASLDR
jgi:DNA-binding NarL/FixJ family response regulator